jgi:hypothetical protein
MSLSPLPSLLRPRTAKYNQRERRGMVKDNEGERKEEEEMR